MTILSLNDSLAAKFDRVGDRAWNGDHSCSLDNMEISCFASEGCNVRHSATETFRLRDLMRNHTKVVATDETREQFRGCASAHPCADSSGLLICYPDFRFEEDAFLVSNLCVSHESRGHGVAKEMMSFFRARCGTIYVLVALPSRSASPQVFSYMEKRSRNLVDIYRRMNFAECARCESNILLRQQR